MSSVVGPLAGAAASYALIYALNARLPACTRAWYYYQMRAPAAEIEACLTEAHAHRHRKCAVLTVDALFVGFYTVFYVVALCPTPWPVRAVAIVPGVADALETALFVRFVYRPPSVAAWFGAFRALNLLKQATATAAALAVVVTWSERFAHGGMPAECMLT